METLLAGNEATLLTGEVCFGRGEVGWTPRPPAPARDGRRRRVDTSARAEGWSQLSRLSEAAPKEGSQSDESDSDNPREALSGIAYAPRVARRGVPQPLLRRSPELTIRKRDSSRSPMPDLLWKRPCGVAPRAEKRPPALRRPLARAAAKEGVTALSPLPVRPVEALPLQRSGASGDLDALWLGADPASEPSPES